MNFFIKYKINSIPKRLLSEEPVRRYYLLYTQSTNIINFQNKLDSFDIISIGNLNTAKNSRTIILNTKKSLLTLKYSKKIIIKKSLIEIGSTSLTYGESNIFDTSLMEFITNKKLKNELIASFSLKPKNLYYEILNKEPVCGEILLSFIEENTKHSLKYRKLRLLKEKYLITKLLPAIKKIIFELLKNPMNIRDQKVLSIIDKIAGLGEGSTPLSDDIIAGIVAASFIVSNGAISNKNLRNKKFEINIKNLQTTLISRIMILDAYKGYVPLNIKKILLKFPALSTKKDNKKIINLLSDIGHNSGFGIFTGIAILLTSLKYQNLRRERTS